MTHRFFVEAPIAADTVELTGPEARHAIQVMRLGPDDTLVLFDGSGAEYRARILSTSKHTVSCQVVSRHVVERELSRELILAAALPKGDRQRWLVEKAVELGVQRFIPLVTRRGVARPQSSTIRRLRRTVVEASKQCGRNLLMEVSPAVQLDSIELPATTLRLLAHPSEQPTSQLPNDHSSVCVAVGPEGGFTSEEIESASRGGWQLVSLGPRILRTETAALVLAAWMGHEPTS